MKYIKIYETNYKFKVNDYVKHIIYSPYTNKNKIYQITNIDKIDSIVPNYTYFCVNVKDESEYFWASAKALYIVSEEELAQIKYNL